MKKITLLFAMCFITAKLLNSGNFSYANLSNAVLVEADFTGSTLTGANLTAANLTGANLTDADLSGADLTDAILTGANLTRAILREATLIGTNFNYSIFDQTDLTGADAFKATFINAHINKIIVRGARLPSEFFYESNLLIPDDIDPCQFIYNRDSDEADMSNSPKSSPLSTPRRSLIKKPFVEFENFELELEKD